MNRDTVNMVGIADMGQNRYHIHFAVNAICLNNGYKWNTTKSDREKR